MKTQTAVSRINNGRVRCVWRAEQWMWKHLSVGFLYYEAQSKWKKRKWCRCRIKLSLAKLSWPFNSNDAHLTLHIWSPDDDARLGCILTWMWRPCQDTKQCTKRGKIWIVEPFVCGNWEFFLWNWIVCYHYLVSNQSIKVNIQEWHIHSI